MSLRNLKKFKGKVLSEMGTWCACWLAGSVVWASSDNIFRQDLFQCLWTIWNNSYLELPWARGFNVCMIMVIEIVKILSKSYSPEPNGWWHTVWYTCTVSRTPILSSLPINILFQTFGASDTLEVTLNLVKLCLYSNDDLMLRFYLYVKCFLWIAKC